MVAKIDLAGLRFGKLVAIEPTEERINRYVVWRCRCDCGGEKFVPSGSLLSGNTRSCGCERGRAKTDLTERRFGKLVAVEPTQFRSGTAVVWRCKCDCGNEKLVRSDALTNGNTKSCGCLRRKED